MSAITGLREQSWPGVLQGPATINGTALVVVPDATGFHPKQIVYFVLLGNSSSSYEVKQILSTTSFLVGPPGKGIGTVSNVPVAWNGAMVTANGGQDRSSITSHAVFAAVYAEEPTVALRVNFVDYWGDQYTAENPIPIVFDGTVNVGNVRVTEYDDDPLPGDIHSSIRVGNGTNDLNVNTDGSINVNVINSTSEPGVSYEYNEVTSVASGVETTVLTLTAPTQGARVTVVEVSGDNVALFHVKLNGVTLATKRSWWTNFNQTFNFEDFSNGLLLTSGQILTVTALHSSVHLGTFESTVLYT